jgi:hypothetical protein
VKQGGLGKSVGVFHSGFDERHFAESAPFLELGPTLRNWGNTASAVAVLSHAVNTLRNEIYLLLL